MRFILITDSGIKFHIDFVYRSGRISSILGSDWSKSAYVVITLTRSQSQDQHRDQTD